MTLKVTFTVPQFAADALANGLSVIDDLIFDRAASPSGGIGLTREDPNFPIACILFMANQDRVRQAQAMIEIVADLAGFDAPNLRVEEIAEQDWVKITQEGLPPVQVGPFYLRGSHSPAASAGMHDLLIDAGLAFGTGHHETTRGCLALYDQVLKVRQARRVLDMGCGTGVLAMAAAKVGVQDVVGIELDADSVEVAKENVALNGVADPLTLIAGGTPDLGGGAYDLIFANILAGPLISLAPGLTSVASSPCDLLLAGLLVEQEGDVLQAYLNQGWTRQGGFHDGQWSLLWMTKS